MGKQPAKPSASGKKSVTGDLFALVVNASAAAEQENYPPGQRHMLIVIVRGDSVEDALTIAVEGMVEAGWRDHEIARASQLSPDIDEEELGQLGPSISDAQATGLSITVLADPISDKRH